MAVVEVDQAVIISLGLVQAAGGAGQFGQDVTGQGMLGGQLQGFLGAAAGFGPIAAVEGQPGQLGLDFRLLVGQRREGLDRRDGLALRLQASGQAQRGLGRGRGIRLIDLGRFFVAAVHEQRTGLGEIGARRDRNDNQQQYRECKCS